MVSDSQLGADPHGSPRDQEFSGAPRTAIDSVRSTRTAAYRRLSASICEREPTHATEPINCVLLWPPSIEYHPSDRCAQPIRSATCTRGLVRQTGTELQFIRKMKRPPRRKHGIKDDPGRLMWNPTVVRVGWCRVEAYHPTGRSYALDASR